MSTKPSGYTVKLVGPGMTFDRPISEEVAHQIINLVMTGRQVINQVAAPAWLMLPLGSAVVTALQSQAKGS